MTSKAPTHHYLLVHHPQEFVFSLGVVWTCGVPVVPDCAHWDPRTKSLSFWKATPLVWRQPWKGPVQQELYYLSEESRKIVSTFGDGRTWPKRHSAKRTRQLPCDITTNIASDNLNKNVYRARIHQNTYMEIYYQFTNSTVANMTGKADGNTCDVLNTSRSAYVHDWHVKMFL